MSRALHTARPRTRPWKQALAWLAFLGPFFYLSYGIANYLALLRYQQQGLPAIVFDWEHAIPFVPWTIYPYWTINAFYVGSLFLCNSRHMLRRHGLRLLTAQLLAVTCFLLWPLVFSFGQPEVHGAPALLFDALRGFDKPFNQAPSLHIALAVILWDVYRRFIHAPWARLLLHVWTALICISVLTTYQHHFIDIPTGVLLGALCVWAWPLGRRVSMWQAWRLTRHPARLRLAGLYALGSVGLALLALAVHRYVLPGWGLWLFWPAVSVLLVAFLYLGVGARGFGMDAQGQRRWSATWLLAPYLLAARINAWAFTRRLPAANRVLPGVLLGRVPSVDEWQAAGQPMVLSLAGERSLAHLPNARCLPWLDLIPTSPAALQRAVLMTNAAAANGNGVWVCCALGFSRSAATVTAWLQQQGLADAAAQVRNARPQVVLHTGWQQAIATHRQRYPHAHAATQGQIQGDNHAQ